MKKIGALHLSLFVLFLSFWISSSTSWAFSSEREIRVRLEPGIEKVRVRGFDLQFYQVLKSSSGRSQWIRRIVSSDRTSEWEMRCQEGKVYGERLHVPAAVGHRFEVSGPISIQTPVGFLHYENQLYRNELKIYSSGVNCEVVNEVALEKYLDGLVNAEFSAQWNEQAVAAQVVAARTYAYYQMLDARKKGSHFDVDATVKDQVYHGSVQEDYQSSQIVKKTQGLVLTYPAGSHAIPMKAFYHSTCGGGTELPEKVWGIPMPGLKKRVGCPYCVHSPRFEWSLELDQKEVINAFVLGLSKEGLQPGWPQRSLEVLKIGKLMDLRLDKALEPPGRVSKVTSVWMDGKTLVELPISGVQFRNWMGASRFKSTLFQVALHKTFFNKKWIFRGQGNGHGVGLCQWGAKTMGEKGFKMATILRFYYPDALLKKLW